MTPLPCGRIRGYQAHWGVCLLMREGMWSNPQWQTMIVEGRGMGFWTWVRLPSGPLQSKRSNTAQIRNIAVYKNEFGIVLDTSGYGDEQVDWGVRERKNGES